MCLHPTTESQEDNPAACPWGERGTVSEQHYSYYKQASGLLLFTLPCLATLQLYVCCHESIIHVVTLALIMSPDLFTHAVLSFIPLFFFLLLYFALMLRIFFPLFPSSFFTTQCFHHLVQEVSLSAPCKADLSVLSLSNVNLNTLHYKNLLPTSASQQRVSSLSYCFTLSTLHSAL